MSRSRDLERLAERYLDLWERQLAALANDPAARQRLSAIAAALDEATFGGANEERPRAAADDSEPDT